MANDILAHPHYELQMTQQEERSVPEAKVQFIPEWAEKAGLKQADIVRALSVPSAEHDAVNKSTVSRWFKGTAVPHPKGLARLIEILGLRDASSLFRSPDEEWLIRFLRRRTRGEVAKIIIVLKTAFGDERDDDLPEYESIAKESSDRESMSEVEKLFFQYLQAINDNNDELANEIRDLLSALSGADNEEPITKSGNNSVNESGAVSESAKLLARLINKRTMKRH